MSAYGIWTISTSIFISRSASWIATAWGTQMSFGAMTLSLVENPSGHADAAINSFALSTSYGIGSNSADALPGMSGGTVVLRDWTPVAPTMFSMIDWIGVA